MPVKLFRCRICGDPHIGETAPDRCPHCGALKKFVVPIEKALDVSFDVKLNKKDKAFVKKALELEIGNAEFYFCAAEKSKQVEAQKLFKALGKVEEEHASIWKKILKLNKINIKKSDNCARAFKPNLKESHKRESKAIEFYKKAAAECDNARVKELFGAIILIEQDHLHLSEVRLK